jgi:hypothetical protein
MAVIVTHNKPLQREKRHGIEVQEIDKAGARYPVEPERFGVKLDDWPTRSVSRESASAVAS